MTTTDSPSPQQPGDPSAQANTSASPPLPAWPLILCAVAVVTTASQIALTVRGIPIGLADLAAAAATVGVLFLAWRHEQRVSVPVSALAVVAVYCLAALFARSGKAGVAEGVQRVEQIYCGLLVFTVVLRHRRSWLPRLLAVGLTLNVLIALVQMANGFGAPVRGLFGSRVALGLYLTCTLVWLQPFALQWCKCWGTMLAYVVGTALVLFCIAHGQVLLLAVVAVAALGMLHSRRALLLNLGAVLLLLITFKCGHRGTTTLAATLSPFSNGDTNQYGTVAAQSRLDPVAIKVQGPGQLKQSHTELVTALRMAAENPWGGVGAGRYQENIGVYYRELPNPNFNAIEKDTQPGLGILFATVGFPAGICLILLLMSGVASGLREHLAADEENPVFLAGAAGLAVILLGMLISDPFVRGIGWYPALGLACVCSPRAGSTAETIRRELGWRGMLLCGIGYGVILALTLATSGGVDADGLTPSDLELSVTSAGTGPADTQTPSGAAQTIVADIDFFRVLDAGDAKDIKEPVIIEKGTALTTRAATKTIIRIPDKKGTPPDGEPSDMKYGGARFEIEAPKTTKCKIWLRVWWEGSCGNTVCVKAAKDPDIRVVGNDGTYDVWHWLPVPVVYEFSEGVNEIYVLNREDGIRVDQILVTGDLQYVPQGIEEE